MGFVIVTVIMRFLLLNCRFIDKNHVRLHVASRPIITCLLTTYMIHDHMDPLNMHCSLVMSAFGTPVTRVSLNPARLTRVPAQRLSEHICKHTFFLLFLHIIFLSWVSVKSNPQSLPLISLPSAEPLVHGNKSKRSRRKISRQNWERSQLELELCYENWQTR